MELAIPALVFLSIFFAIVFLNAYGGWRHADLIRRLGRYVSLKVEPQRRERINTPFNQRIVRPIVERLQAMVNARISEALRQNLRMKLLNAGYTLQTKPEQYVIKTAAAILATVLAMAAVMYHQNVDATGICLAALVGVPILAGLSHLALTGKIRKRKSKIERELPELLDIAQIGVEAGMSIDSCLERIIREPSKNVMAYEFKIYLQDIKMGLPRAEALRQLYLRTDSKSVKHFADGIVQSLKTGSTLGNILQMIRRDIYEAIRGVAEKKANTTPVVMMIPLIVFIFPTVFIILLGPTLLVLWRELGKMGLEF